MVPLTIIVVGFNRPKELNLLLKSLRFVESPQRIDLVISIDNNGTPEVNKIANEYSWHLGEKKVIIHEKKKGLVQHFIWVGDQTEQYENVLFLEDDMYVSPQIVNFVLQAIPFYEDDDMVAGCSLYDPHFTLSWMFFDKVVDGYDNYFYQHPYWGNVWFKRKWQLFKQYLKTYKLKEEFLPPSIRTWKTGSFKQIFVQYLSETGRTMVFPRGSLLTNVGAAGLHMGEYTYVHSPIPIMASKKNYLFSTLSETCASYDVFEELTPEVIKRLNPQLNEFDFEVDTKQVRDIFTKDYILTNRGNTSSIVSFDGNFKPIECSAILNVGGEGLTLCKKEDVIQSSSDYKRLVVKSWTSHANMESLSLMLHALKMALLKRLP